MAVLDSRERACLAIDLKSFYASVECVERGLDPLTACLVVADESRTEKTICLAVTPALRALGIPGRARLFEVQQQVRQINAIRLARAPGRKFTGSSWDSRELQENPSLELAFLTAPPRMAAYMERSTEIYRIYLRYIAPEHIHVYSIDEVLMDVTDYLALYQCTPEELARRMIRSVLEETGITATAGVGTNLYLAKVAMDIVAKHIPPDGNGVRIASLDEMSYRRQLWAHRPLTDFWRVGRGTAAKLEAAGLYTMGDIARCSLSQAGEDRLYQLFGINAELLIDHAWGWEPCTMEAVKAYVPASSSIGSGQVLMRPYTCSEARTVVREMADALVLELVEKRLATDQLVLHAGYDRESLLRPEIRSAYRGPVTRDHYGRAVPASARGSVNLPRFTSSARLILPAVLDLYDRTVHPDLLVRRITLTASRTVSEDSEQAQPEPEQLDLFSDPVRDREESARLDREKKLQQAVLQIRGRYGRNAILKGTSLQPEATGRDRNSQIGGHRA